MQNFCDVCGKREGTIFDRAIQNNVTVRYVYCETCYKSLLSKGINPRFEVDRIRKFNSHVCSFCGTDTRDFESVFLFGCPHCYENMRAIEGMDAIAPIATFREAYEVERTMEAIRRSFRERRWVKLEEIH